MWPPPCNTPSECSTWYPQTTSSSGAGPKHTYVVKPGDTLWTVAEHAYSGDPREGVWKLEQRNHLTGTTIVPGEKLVIS